MNYKISFREMDRLGMEKLSKQSPSTLEEKGSSSRTQKAKFIKERETQILNYALSSNMISSELPLYTRLLNR